MAYCLDQAVGHFGVVLEHEINKAGHKPTKDERRTESARLNVLNRYLGTEDSTLKRQYADPAILFPKD